MHNDKAEQLKQRIKKNTPKAAKRSVSDDVLEEVLEGMTPEEVELVEKIGKRHAEQLEIRRRLREGLSRRGRLRRNAACPCGSGKKFKKCCLHDMKNKLHGNTKPDPEPSNEKEQPTDEIDD